MHELAWEALEETVLAHPFVVVDLAQVVAAGIREDDNHEAAFIELGGDLHGRLHRRAGRAANQDPFLPGNPPGDQEGVAVVDLYDPIDQFEVDRPRDEVFTDPLDLVRLRVLARVERPVRVGPHRHNRRLLLLQEAGDTGHGSPGAVAGNDHTDLAPRLQHAPSLGIFDHPEPDPVLDAAARIQRLDLGQDRGAKPGGDAMKPHQRRVPDGLQDAAQDLHGPHDTWPPPSETRQVACQEMSVESLRTSGGVFTCPFPWRTRRWSTTPSRAWASGWSALSPKPGWCT